MNEAFLHHVWQFQCFRPGPLKTTGGDDVLVFQPGQPNTNAGPDFLQARIKIGELEWNGHVEIHVRASDWQAHRHQTDGAYNNVILHVVWQHDRPVQRADGSPIPCLVLAPVVDPAVHEAYRRLVNGRDAILCKPLFAQAPEIYRTAMLERAVVERLEEKARAMLQHLAARQNDWEQTTMELLLRNFGFKVNADAFAQLGQRVQWKIIQKHRQQPEQVEALLFGLAGFLDTAMADEYHTHLRQQFRALEQLHRLQDVKMNGSQWRFLRLRPANFPTVRIAQFSQWICAQTSLFAALTEATDVALLREQLAATAAPYWHRHYRFGKPARAYSTALGEESITNIIINTVAPLQAAAGLWYGQPERIERAARLLEQLPAEKNRITRLWQELPWPPASAHDSQGLIQLYHHYCEKRRCLACAIGTRLLKPAARP
jgi:hypothetical protein